MTALLLFPLLPGALSSQSVQEFAYNLINLIPADYLKNTGLTIFPLLKLPAGGEQQAFAGAYTAVARDLSFFEANPSASSLLEKTELALFHANIIADVNLESVAFSQRFGDFGWGTYLKLLHTPFESLGIRGEQLAASSYVESVLGLNASYTFFRDYYFTGIALGVNLKFAYRSIPEELYAHVTGLNGKEQSAFGFMADVGLLTRFNFLKTYVARDKNFSVGLSLQNLGPLVLDEPLPTQFRAGLSYQPFRFLLLTGDFKLPINLKDSSLSEAPGFGAGFALQFVDVFSIKGGFYLEGGGPEIALGANVDLKDIDFTVNYSIDLASTFRIPDHLSIQAKVKFGDNGRAELAKKVDALYIDALVALSDSDYEKVIQLCSEALLLDPGFSPAKETKALAEKSLKLVKELEAIQFSENENLQ